ncbi:protein mono-ADP-ribosyltransferase PARP11 isoform X1 [Sphaerodactylus townsendi]|uniref:protein mono-ADP-ribosyltransferase PARP11 isoform X1 n=1 Tax=Sphaerodactylus townsendi TaxID=933632 RepID=UPI0020260EA5|nr:protein mono-ADP-ribosyltransferase PARP11 isoform X1 [Sphaerodactylus townsendi]XP_048365609.1 protein mono-ADP-ribosyltransferase PARP11 isoform X1 [Sphaerodactylus townsendi]
MFQGGDDFSQNGAGQLEEMDTSDTQWGWFYLAECGKWHMFETDSSTHCSVSTEDIERSFRMNPEDSVGFTTAKFNYRLDFSGMKQTNLTTGKQRPIKRAPFSITAFSYVCENQSIPIPSHWENVNSEEAYQFIPLQKQTNEYKEVASHFGETMEGSRIKRIQRIQNLDLWEFFCSNTGQIDTTATPLGYCFSAAGQAVLWSFYTHDVLVPAAKPPGGEAFMAGITRMLWVIWVAGSDCSVAAARVWHWKGSAFY